MSESEKPAGGIEVLLDTAEAARVLNVDEGTLKNWRCAGRGPDYVVVGGGGGRLVRYTARALNEHIEEGTRHAVRGKRRGRPRRERVAAVSASDPVGA